MLNIVIMGTMYSRSDALARALSTRIVNCAAVDVIGWSIQELCYWYSIRSESTNYIAQALRVLSPQIVPGYQRRIQQGEELHEYIYQSGTRCHELNLDRNYHRIFYNIPINLRNSLPRESIVFNISYRKHYEELAESFPTCRFSRLFPFASVDSFDLDNERLGYNVTEAVSRIKQHT